MSDHTEHHGTESAHVHPTAKKYLGIAIVLTIITVIEVAVFYVPSLKAFLPVILLSLSAFKFALVAMFYMHLKFDHKMFSWVFVVPMVFISAICLGLMAMFAVKQ